MDLLRVLRFRQRCNRGFFSFIVWCCDAGCVVPDLLKEPIAFVLKCSRSMKNGPHQETLCDTTSHFRRPETWKFIGMFTAASYKTISWARWIRFMFWNPVSVEYACILITTSMKHSQCYSRRRQHTTKRGGQCIRHSSFNTTPFFSLNFLVTTTVLSSSSTCLSHFI
jgi:hypothetical protein